MKRLVISFLAAWFALLLWGRMPVTTIVYSGVVLDSEGKRIEYATLLLQSGNQSVGTITDSLGTFRMSVSPDLYKLTVQCMGYEQMSKTVRLMNSYSDTLYISSSSYLLNEVVVQASPIVRKADRYVLHIPLSANKDGVELLRQAPGVCLTDERIGINGASGAKIFVDHREIKLTGEMLVTYLRSLKSEDIARIEVLPMAGADRDADAQGGAIYIYMRRRVDKGIQGNLSMASAFAHSLQRYQPAGSLNLHQGKWDWYVSGSGTFVPENAGEVISKRQYSINKDFSSYTSMKEPSRYGTFRMGTLFTIDTLNRVGVELEYFRRSYDRDSKSSSLLSTNQLLLKSQGIYQQNESYDMYSVTANYLHNLDARGSVLKLVTDYTSKKLEGNNHYNIFQQAEEYVHDTIYRSRSHAVYQIATADFSWKQQLQKKTSFQVGVKYTYTGMKDDACYEGLEADESWKRNATYGYELNYSENIGAVYATYAMDWGKYSLHAGMRGEYTYTSDRTNHLKRKYWDWFPHIDVTYAFDPIRKWMLIGQYARYIERPAFNTLNPNRIQTSDYSYQIGNPILHPTYINKFSATLVYNYRYTLTIGGSMHHDLIREFTKQDANNPDVSYVIYENHDRENHWFVALSLPWQPTTWMNLTSSVVGVKQCIRMYKQSDYTNHYLFFGNANATFNLPSDYSLELQYNGASRLYSGNSEIAPFHTLNVLMRKKWKEGRWVAVLGVDNVFNRKNAYVSRLDTYTAESNYKSASKGRLVKLTLTWNFNSGKKSQKVMVEKRSSDERNRFDGK